MSFELIPISAGAEPKFEAEIPCECCQGKGVRVRVPVIMMGDGPFRELTVQDELRRQSYQTYAEKRGFPWWQRLSHGIVFLGGFFLLVAIIMVGLRTLFDRNVDSAALFFFMLFVLWIVWPLCIPKVMRALRGEGYEAWEKDRDAAQAMYVKILKEYGEITDPHKAVIWISGETKAEAIKRDSILVMIGK